ncbi:MAG: SAP domain-containing protein [Gemmatimonadota bacterium]
MDILEIRRIAGRLGINPAGMEKVDLVRAIQRAEGVADCFGCAASEECEEEGCLWREDCFFESVLEETAV